VSDWTTDPAEIPPDGERQDMTLSDMGFSRNHSPGDDNPTELVFQCVIDNGEYEGFRLSNTFLVDSPSGEGTFKAFLRRTEAITGALSAVEGQILEGNKHAIVALREDLQKEHRFSALVGVEEVEKDTERLAVYNLTGFDQPQQDASLTLQKKPRQFYRD
jgi:hypothetical protein